MEKELLLYLLATFPTEARSISTGLLPDTSDSDDHLLIRGYRVPFSSPVDDVMLSVLAEFRRGGFGRDSHFNP